MIAAPRQHQSFLLSLTFYLQLIGHSYLNKSASEHYIRTPETVLPTCASESRWIGPQRGLEAGLLAIVRPGYPAQIPFNIRHLDVLMAEDAWDLIR